MATPQRFNDNTSESKLSALENDQDEYLVGAYTYPLNLQQLPNAMLFNINVQDVSLDAKNAKDNGGAARDSRSTAQKLQAGQILGTTVADNTFGTGLKATLNRKTTRIKQSVALYTPETIVYDSTQQYSTPSMLDTLGPAGVALTQIAAGQAGNAGMAGKLLGAAGIGSLLSGVEGTLGKLAGKVASINDSSTKTLLTAATGYALNPLIEVLYNSPTLRTFAFDFVFAPKSQQEADQVWNIIYTFRRYHAPGYTAAGSQGLAGAVFAPPAEWDITFLRQDQGGSFVENINLPKINTCVLTDINTNYTPENQFVTFQDGMPVHITMRLAFTEVGVITQSEIDRGF